MKKNSQKLTSGFFSSRPSRICKKYYHQSNISNKNLRKTYCVNNLLEAVRMEAVREVSRGRPDRLDILHTPYKSHLRAFSSPCLTLTALGPFHAVGKTCLCKTDLSFPNTYIVNIHYGMWHWWGFIWARNICIIFVWENKNQNQPKQENQSYLLFISVWRINSLLSQSLFPVTVLITLHTSTEHYYLHDITLLFVFDETDKTLQAREHRLDFVYDWFCLWLNLTWWFWRRILIWLWNDCNWSL